MKSLKSGILVILLIISTLIFWGCSGYSSEPKAPKKTLCYGEYIYVVYIPTKGISDTVVLRAQRGECK